MITAKKKHVSENTCIKKSAPRRWGRTLRRARLDKSSRYSMLPSVLFTEQQPVCISHPKTTIAVNNQLFQISPKIASKKAPPAGGAGPCGGLGSSRSSRYSRPPLVFNTNRQAVYNALRRRGRILRRARPDESGRVLRQVFCTQASFFYSHKLFVLFNAGMSASVRKFQLFQVRHCFCS